MIMIVVNHYNEHWTAAIINFRKKRIESYDSVGDSHQNVCDVSTYIQIVVSF